MNSKATRIFHVLFTALMLLSVLAGTAAAQSSTPRDSTEMNLVYEREWTATARWSGADDFALVCPSGDRTLRDPNHPCNTHAAPAGSTIVDDLVLVCPMREVLNPAHPCYGRGAAATLHGAADDYTIVCPIGDRTLPGDHPCNDAGAPINRDRPDDLVLVCPVKEVLDPYHPCFDH